ncbi:alternative ribosome rescue aminoacyl-tRNA hydrolase ArfB [Pengzhenrongella frigida]|uniref:Aminoacyl-tRNA hydrolase n=1 Tax=Pengzhenrongella frigida TaxID=1259133 RepID=A0A4Q5N243_9MICO|nr:alternative ribosome rescue aminoacyl-tRNA hydrolase ArfB [Cellulomonas sp. HLT2-17]RYV52189.1 aminoacyl-tRNA hydrolase [Cellulomonas sp. HLT2-17]
MFGPVTLRGDVVVPEDELSWRFSRSSGPGGQSVNTADSRVELSWDVSRTGVLPPELRGRVLDRLAGRLVGGVLTIAASEYRSQLRNREAALVRFVALLDGALAPPGPVRRATRPSRGSRTRRTASERRHREIKAQRRRPPSD